MSDPIQTIEIFRRERASDLSGERGYRLVFKGEATAEVSITNDSYGDALGVLVAELLRAHYEKKRPHE